MHAYEQKARANNFVCFVLNLRTLPPIAARGLIHGVYSSRGGIDHVLDAKKLQFPLLLILGQYSPSTIHNS